MRGNSTAKVLLVLGLGFFLMSVFVRAPAVTDDNDVPSGVGPESLENAGALAFAAVLMLAGFLLIAAAGIVAVMGRRAATRGDGAALEERAAYRAAYDRARHGSGTLGRYVEGTWVCVEHDRPWCAECREAPDDRGRVSPTSRSGIGGDDLPGGPTPSADVSRTGTGR